MEGEREDGEVEVRVFGEGRTRVRMGLVGMFVLDSAIELLEEDKDTKEEDERSVVGEVRNVVVGEVDDLVVEHVHNDTVPVHIECHTDPEEEGNVEAEEADVVQGL